MLIKQLLLRYTLKTGSLERTTKIARGRCWVLKRQSMWALRVRGKVEPMGQSVSASSLPLTLSPERQPSVGRPPASATVNQLN